jgi:predicted MPP superfamily phosphohydrolase
VLLGLGDAGKALLHRSGAIPLADPSRRLWLARAVAAVAGAGAGGLALLGGAGATAGAVLTRRVRVPLARLPASLSGYRIVQITDIHVGPTIGRGFIEQIVARVNALKPDLVAITGDMVDGSVEQLGELVEPIRQLVARDGVFFVTGNHEYYVPDLPAWLAFLADRGIRVLRNEHLPIRGDAGFDLAGVDDWSAHPNLPKALEGRDSARPVVLLAHQPRQVKGAAELGVDLQLSGHTHGGQLFPFSLIVKVFEPYLAGLFTVGTTQLYVSRGTGYWGPPMRLGAPAEITELELVRA